MTGFLRKALASRPKGRDGDPTPNLVVSVGSYFPLEETLRVFFVPGLRDALHCDFQTMPDRRAIFVDEALSRTSCLYTSAGFLQCVLRYRALQLLGVKSDKFNSWVAKHREIAEKVQPLMNNLSAEILALVRERAGSRVTQVPLKNLGDLLSQIGAPVVKAFDENFCKLIYPVVLVRFDEVSANLSALQLPDWAKEFEQLSQYEARLLGWMVGLIPPDGFSPKARGIIRITRRVLLDGFLEPERQSGHPHSHLIENGAALLRAIWDGTSKPFEGDPKDIEGTLAHHRLMLQWRQGYRQALESLFLKFTRLRMDGPAAQQALEEAGKKWKSPRPHGRRLGRMDLRIECDLTQARGQDRLLGKMFGPFRIGPLTLWIQPDTAMVTLQGPDGGMVDAIDEALINSLKFLVENRATQEFRVGIDRHVIRVRARYDPGLSKTGIQIGCNYRTGHVNIVNWFDGSRGSLVKEAPIRQVFSQEILGFGKLMKLVQEASRTGRVGRVPSDAEILKWIARPSVRKGSPSVLISVPPAPAPLFEGTSPDRSA